MNFKKGDKVVVISGKSKGVEGTISSILKNNKVIKRIYGICFENEEELNNHLNFLEEAKKRDHRKLGKELDLFFFV